MEYVTAIGAILIPVVLFYMGRKVGHYNLISNIIEHIGSEHRQTRLATILFLETIKRDRLLPESLFESLVLAASSDDPEIAGVAELLGRDVKINKGNRPQYKLLIELLAPLKVHFDRTRNVFDLWQKQDLFVEEEIYQINARIRELLVAKFHLLNDDESRNHARQLMGHYKAWMEKYHALRPNGIRDPNVDFVFVGPDGYPFPAQSEQYFLSALENVITDMKNR